MTACSICNGTVGRHDLSAHTAWNRTRGVPTRPAPDMSWAAELGRLITVNERLRVQLADALHLADYWRRVAREQAP